MNSALEHELFGLVTPSRQTALARRGARGSMPALVFAAIAGVLPGFVRAQNTTRVSVSSAGDQANGESYYAAVSRNGRLVVFASAASNLVLGDTNGGNDWFLHDLPTHTTTRISVTSAGAQSSGDPSADSPPAFTADGRYVVFSSAATNLVAGDTNGFRDVFLRDLQLGTTTRVSVDAGGAQANSASSRPAFATDGRYVTFQSFATNLVAGDTNAQADIFRKDLLTGAVVRVSVATGGAQANNSSLHSSMSSQGQYIVFDSLATNLVAGDTNANYDVFMRDVVSGTTVRIGVSSSGTQANNFDVLDGNLGMAPGASGALFSSFATNLVPGDTNGRVDIFLRDLPNAVTTLVSTTSTGDLANDHCYNSSFSAFARFVLFDSIANNIVPDDTAGVFDVFVRDLVAGTIVRASIGALGVESDGNSRVATISADGRVVAFESIATNLVTGDTNNVRDVFVREMWGGGGAGDDDVADYGDAPDGIPSCQGTPNCNPIAEYPTLSATTNALPGRTAPFHTGANASIDYWLGAPPDREEDAFQPCCDWISATHGGPAMDTDDGPLILCLDPGCLSGVVVGTIDGAVVAAGCFGPEPPIPTTVAFWIYRVGMGAQANPAEPRFINIGVDVNLDGAYGDAALEWPTRDEPFPFVPGGQQVMISGPFPVLVVFACGAPGGWCIGPFWTRFHAGPQEMLPLYPNGDWDGSGAVGGYPRGETEDWVVYCDPQACGQGSGGCSTWSDCNQNNRPDIADIALGYSYDQDQNDIPDECGNHYAYEFEPNSVKTEATPATMIDGDTLHGYSNGSTGGAGNTSSDSSDYYLVETAPLAMGIYRHRLVFQGATGHAGSIRGLAVTSPPPQITNTDVALQLSSPATSPPSFVQWYGFGRSEQLYFGVTGTSSSGDYTVALQTDRVQPDVVPQHFHAGPITITTVGQGHMTDTEIHVFDGALNPVAGFKNDDTMGSTQSTLTRTFAPGTYFVAIGRYNVCDNQITGSDDIYQTGPVMDFPGGLLSSVSFAGPIDVSFAISDGSTSATIAASLPSEAAYEVAWYRVHVSSVSEGPLVTFCEPGIGSVIQCPCTNPPSGPDRGCNNSSNTGGASLTAVGVASLSSDSIVFTTHDEKPTATSVLLQGTAIASSGAVYGQGVRCIAGLLKRLYTRVASGGSVTMPDGFELPVSAQSAALGDTIAPGQSRHYLVYYRDPNVLGGCPASSTFNATHSGSITWGP